MTNTIEIENLNISDLDIPKDETLQEVASSCENIATSSESIATSCDNIASSCGDIAKDTTLQSTNTALGSLATDATLQATNTALGSISGSLSGFATDTTLQSVKGSIDSVASAEGTLNTTLGDVAKDATLQNTNTALGGLNISLGGIIKDTTGQSIDASVGNISTVLSDVATDTTLATVVKDTTLQATNTALGSLMADTTGQSIASAISGLGATLGSNKANISGDNIANPATFRQNIEASKVDYIEQIFPSDSMTLIANYPTGKTKDNMLVIGIAFYRNAAWIYVESSYDLYLQTSQIALTLRTGSEYLKGCSCRIIYV